MEMIRLGITLIHKVLILNTLNSRNSIDSAINNKKNPYMKVEIGVDSDVE